MDKKNISSYSPYTSVGAVLIFVGLGVAVGSLFPYFFGTEEMIVQGGMGASVQPARDPKNWQSIQGIVIGLLVSFVGFMAWITGAINTFRTRQSRGTGNPG